MERRVLIVVPTLGERPAFLRETLVSITTQPDAQADVVLVAPRAAREARAIARDFDATVIDDPGGMAASLNLGFDFANASHEYANWIGDDDVLRPGALAVASRALDERPEVVMAFGSCDYIDDRGTVIWTNRPSRAAVWLMTWGPNLIPQPGALFRMSALRRAGGLDPSLSYSMDLDLWIRMRAAGRIHNTGEVLAAFRWHTGSLTVANRGRSLAEAARVKRRYYPRAFRPMATAWEVPVRAATHIAASRLTRQAVRNALDR